MAEPDAGFADERYVLIRGEHWHSNANRRPVLLQAWYAQFADLLLNDVMRHSTYTHQPQLHDISLKGAHDIVVITERTPSLLPLGAKGTPEGIQVLTALKTVREKRNAGTHDRIQNCNLLEDLLRGMYTFCESIVQFPPFQSAANRIQHFAHQCKKELTSISQNKQIY